MPCWPIWQRRALRALGCCIFVAVLTAGMSGESRGAEVAWRKDFAAATQEARRLQRPLLVQFTAPWCGYCHKMQRTTFSDPNVVSHIHDGLVPVLLDADEHAELMERLGVDCLPVTARPAEVSAGLSNSFGFGGQNVSLIFERVAR